MARHEKWAEMLEIKGKSTVNKWRQQML